MLPSSPVKKAVTNDLEFSVENNKERIKIDAMRQSKMEMLAKVVYFVFHVVVNFGECKISQINCCDIQGHGLVIIGSLMWMNNKQICDVKVCGSCNENFTYNCSTKYCVSCMPKL